MNDVIPVGLDVRPLIWSYTLLNTYRNVCPHQAYRRYVRRDVPYVETPALKRGNDVHTAFEHRIGAHQPLPVDMQQWESFAAPFDGRGAMAELKLGITREGRPTGFFDKDVWGRGKLDVSLVQGERAYLGDFKTGKVREDPFELRVQAVLLHARYPALRKIMGQFYWLAENRAGAMHDLSNTRETWTEICAIFAEMEKAKKSGNWPKRKSGLCGFCNVEDCEYRFNAK